MSSSFFNVPDYHIEKLCRYLKDDQYIASYLGVTRARVKRIRDTIPKPEPEKEDDIYVGSNGFDQMIAHGTKQLLLRQLASGFHWLNQTRLNEVLKEIEHG